MRNAMNNSFILFDVIGRFFYFDNNIIILGFNL